MNITNFIDMSGRRIGTLLILGRAAASTKAGSARWCYRCDCGGEGEANGTRLRTTQMTCPSCAKRTHGHTLRGKTSSEYMSYRGMIQRCYSPNFNRYSRYGGRGIIVCERWRISFDNFLADMGLKPRSRMSLERVNNDGNYESSNCIWASATEQNRNRSNTRMVMYEGALTPLAKVVEISGTTFSFELVYERIHRGWDLKSALTAPLYAPAKERVGA